MASTILCYRVVDGGNVVFPVHLYAWGTLCESSLSFLFPFQHDMYGTDFACNRLIGLN